MDRRNSKDGRPQRPPANPDVFDDEHALDLAEDNFMPSVSDGFRPADARGGFDSDRQDHDRNEPRRPQITTTKSQETDLRRVATRNSIAKVPFPRESASQDGQNPTQYRELSSQATPLQHRESVSSTGSFATMARSESPFGTGPSHPYGMYPQNTMSRDSSIATTSTQQQPQRSISLQRPQHPYGMYPQNVVEDEPPMPQVQTAIPVGFPGINTGFHRQLGPDGEEQDIIGLDGHTEQLPPYSRYPEEGPTKASMAAEASATPVESAPNPMAASNDALLTNIAPTSPASPVSPVSPMAPAPVAPARLPQQRPETQTGNAAAPRPATTSEAASLLTTSTSEEDSSEKPELARSVKKGGWRSKRLWGKVPLTVVLVLLILLLIFAVVLGAAIGTFVAKNKNKGKDKDHNPKKDDPALLNAPSNSLFDATPITTPTSIPPLPTGQFSLPLGYAQESSPGCLPQGNQYAAWSCRMSFAPLVLTINSASDTTHNATINAFVAPDGSIQYGLQSPVVDNVQLQLVTDLDYKGFGPAWHFQTRYTKVVYLTPDEFAAGSSLRKRQDDKPFRHRFQVQPGDSPWQCIWNDTLIEGYIYVKDNSTAATQTGFPTPSNNPFASVDPFASTQTSAPTTSTVTGSPATTTPAPTNNVKQRQDGPPPFPRLPPYPRIVKIEERRLPGSPQPSCKKMQLLDNGQLAEAPSANGGSIVVWLQEQGPTMQEFYAGGPPPPDPSSSSNATEKRRRRAMERRRDPSDACHCQWIFQ